MEDLLRLCPDNQDPFTWAEEHLRALTDKAVPTLVPARGVHGHCHWLFEGQCLVHEKAPYSCAFFDTHMPREEVERRSEATRNARQKDAVEKGLYFRVWRHLCRNGLVGPSGDRQGLQEEWCAIRQNQVPGPEQIKSS